MAGADGGRGERGIDYGRADLIELGLWPRTPKKHRRYGGVLFDSSGRLLLREPLNHYGGYHWTFPKGRPDPGETPAQTALREVREETGYTGEIVGHVPGTFSGSPDGSTNYFYLMRVADGVAPDEAVRRADAETAAVRWVSPAEAPALIALTPNARGRRRDLAILEAAVRAHGALDRP
jgi:8-oxo-dGTP diphosphatase